MSNEVKPVVIDKRDQEKYSTEAVLILAVVLGFFLMILIFLCLIRRKKAVKTKLFTSKESIKGSHSRERASWTASTGPSYYVSHSSTDGSLELISEGALGISTGMGQAFQRVGHNSGKFYDCEISEDGENGKVHELELNPMQSDGLSSVIYQPKTMLYPPDSSYQKSTRCASEATYFSTSSVENLEDFQNYKMYEGHEIRGQYNQFNQYPEGPAVLEHPIGESQVGSNSILKIPLSNVDIVQNPVNQDSNNKWHFLSERPPSCSSASESYNSADLVSTHSGTVRHIILSENRADDTADIALHTPFLESDQFTSSSSSNEFPYDADERDGLHTSVNHKPHYDNIERVYESENWSYSGSSTHKSRYSRNAPSGKEEEIPMRGSNAGEVQKRITAGGEPWVVSPTWKVIDEDVNIIRRSPLHQGHRHSVERPAL